MTMAVTDVRGLLEMAVTRTGLEHIARNYSPRLLSNDDPAYISEELKQYPQSKGMVRTHGAPYHPMTQANRDIKSEGEDQRKNIESENAVQSITNNISRAVS